MYLGFLTLRDRYLEERHPDRFTAIPDRYDARLEEINRKIGELTQESA